MPFWLQTNNEDYVEADVLSPDLSFFFLLKQFNDGSAMS